MNKESYSFIQAGHEVLEFLETASCEDIQDRLDNLHEHMEAIAEENKNNWGFYAREDREVLEDGD